MSGHWLFGPNLNELVEFTDPFKSDFIQTVTMAMNRNPITGEFMCSGRVHYQIGNTGGYQEFNAKDLPSLIRLMSDFINSKK